jgi:phosphopantetheine--protein transferase-like protein
MILGIGTDIVDIDRFKKWEDFSHDQYRKVFSDNELKYCKSNNSSLASRFAAKEAFYKALSSALFKLELTSTEFSFLFLCKNVEVDKNFWDIPYLKINLVAIEDKIGTKLPDMQVDLSLSHEQRYSIAFVIIYLKN